MQCVKVCKLDDLRHLNFTLSMLFLSSLASVVEFLNEEKSSLFKLVECRLKQTKTVVHANFIYAAIPFLFIQT